MYLLWGNHPNKHLKQIYKPLVQSILGKLYSEEHQIYPLRYKNIIYIGDYAEIVVNGQFITLSHFPFSVWHKMEKSSWHLCGHSHYNFQPSMAEDSTSKILDVGWDGHKKPWSFEEVAEVMATKSVPVVDHHV
jgi:calcineurin-like phosphoesterase family protein